ncbi:MAG: EpsG family protein [Anaerotruncus sp.]|nr:EpsG family protein [Anaerotruncus sp.]
MKACPKTDDAMNGGCGLLPYIVLLAAAGAGGLLLCEWKPSRMANLWYLYAMTVVMCIMVMLRSSMVGVDYPTYQAYFETVCQNSFSFLFSPNNIYRFEPGFSLLTYLFSLVTEDAVIYMGLIPVLIIIPRAVTIYKQSCSVWFSVFVYISFGFFSYSMCTLRQELAISIMLFALPYLKDRKILPYMVIIVLAACFHKSLWLMVPVYFLAVIPLNWKSISFYAAGTLFVLIFSVPILGFVTQYVFKAYTPGSYYTWGRSFDTALMILVFLAVALLMKKHILARDPKNIVLLNLYIYASILFILTLKHFIFQRVGLMFLPVATFLLPEMLYSIKPDESKYTELQTLDKQQKKQQLSKFGALRAQLRGERAIYYTAMGLFMAGCFYYYIFLLSSNRLLLVPYTTIFSSSVRQILVRS